MLNKVGREIGPHLRRGQLVLSVLAGATTAALTGILGHDQVVRSMPNTPARLGKGMTVWYATPETTEEQRAQAAALLGALGVQLEVDDEKMVAMATAVSGTGPTYVFLVMEALIDAAVHLGFPRHVAHDLVIETLEGSTLFAKQSGMHPAELRNMVTSPGRHVGRGAPRAGVRPPADGPVRGGLGGVPADRRARRPARGEPRRARREGRGRAEPMTPLATAATPSTFAGRRSPTSAGCDLRAAERDLWADEAALWDRLARRWAGLDDAAWHLPVRPRPTPAGPTGRSPSTSATSPTGRSSPPTTSRWRLETGAGRPTTTTTAATSTATTSVGGRPGRRCPPRPSSARLAAARPRLLAAAQQLVAETIRGHEAWGWVYIVLHGHYLDHLAVIEPWTDALRPRQVDGDPFVADPRAPDHRRLPRARRPRSRRSSTRSSGRSRRRAGRRGRDAGLDPARSRRPPRRLGDGRRPRDRVHATRAPGWPTRTKGIDAWNERHVVAAARREPGRRPGAV